jgi:PII-like signaling protein
MMNALNGDQVLLRVYIGESDKHEGKPLYQWIVEMLRKEKIHGATVLRGILGFGAASHVHTTNILRLSQDLPLIVEVVDTQENIDRVLPQIEPYIGDGLITSEKVKVIKYGTRKGPQG